MRGLSVLLSCMLMALAPPTAGRGQVVYAGPKWAAIDRGDRCDAVTRSLRVAPKGKVQASAGFAFTADRSRWGEFHVQLSRAQRPGSSVMLSLGEQQFLLLSRGDWAWSRGPAQEQAIIAAARNASGMRVEGRDGAGRRFVDSYSLEGAPTAVDAAAAACAGKRAAK